MPNVSHSHANCSLVYLLGGAQTAKLRCKAVSVTYGMNSEESHARRTRAFYPHRRNQGGFSLTFDFIHWAEYSSAMRWFRAYIEDVLDTGKASGMQVSIPNRNFARTGVPTRGIPFGDHTGSMVFSPTIEFVSIANPADPVNSTTKVHPSYTYEQKGQLSSTWFYPDSTMSQPGALQNALYDQKVLTAARNAAVSATIDSDIDQVVSGVGKVIDETGKVIGAIGKALGG